MLWTGRDRREFRGRDRGVRIRGADYGGLPCSPRAPGGVRGQRRGEARRAEGGGCPSTSWASRSGSWMGELRRQRLRFSSDLSGALKGAEALFISVESARGGEWAGRSMR